MRFYSRSAQSFVRRLEYYAQDILVNEMGIRFHQTRFSCNDYTWPLNIACFEDPKILGYFDLDDYLIGINRLLMVQASEDFLKNILRHELAHYICYINHRQDMADHGREYRRLCRNCGWGKEVFNAKVDKHEISLSLQKNREDEKVLDKIKKLMALGSSTNQHEADAATVKANEMMVKYNLEKASLHAADMDEETYYVRTVARAKQINATLRALARILNNFMVRPIFSRSNKNGSYLEVIGTRLNVELAAYVADFLQHEFERLWKEAKQKNPQLKGMVAKNSFLKGIAKGLNKKLNAGQSQKSATNSKQLAKIETALDQAVEMAFPRLGTSYSNTRHCSRGAALGEEAGKNISIHPGLNKGESTPVELLN